MNHQGLLNNSTYNRFGHSLKNSVCDLVSQAAYLGKARQAKLLPLHWLSHLAGEGLVHTEFLLDLKSWIELCITYLANGTVTHERAQPENISDHRLVMRFSEHKGHEFADSCEQHHDMVRSF